MFLPKCKHNDKSMSIKGRSSGSGIVLNLSPSRLATVAAFFGMKEIVLRYSGATAWAFNPFPYCPQRAI